MKDIIARVSFVLWMWKLPFSAFQICRYKAMLNVTWCMTPFLPNRWTEYGHRKIIWNDQYFPASKQKTGLICAFHFHSTGNTFYHMTQSNTVQHKTLKICKIKNFKCLVIERSCLKQKKFHYSICLYYWVEFEACIMYQNLLFVHCWNAQKIAISPYF